MRAVTRLVVVALAALMVLVMWAPAFAGHKHYLQTPGTCVVDIASGQTSQSDGGGFHRFHANVHTGTAGTALTETGQVTVGKSATGQCP